jgi:hypothetical protein
MLNKERIMMKGSAGIYISEELGSAFRWNSQLQVLEWVPIWRDGTFDFDDEGGAVEEHMVGEEIVTFGGEDMCLSDAFRRIKSLLGVTE